MSKTTGNQAGKHLSRHPTLSSDTYIDRYVYTHRDTQTTEYSENK